MMVFKTQEVDSQSFQDISINFVLEKCDSGWL